RKLDTIVITNKVYRDLAAPLRRWVGKQDGNLVLLDKAIKMLRPMRMIKGPVTSNNHYLGYVNFATPGRDVTYEDPLARKINQPGAAEGMSGGEVHRRQTYEAVPIGYAIQDPSGDDANNSPVWTIAHSDWRKARGDQRSVGTTGNRNAISYGEIKFRGGRIRILGALLPMPTKRFDNPFGVANYAITYSGYQLLKNMLQWNR
ncbi:MAG: hypothetical protein M3161_05510, partial [Actinomycetota bacterium]|nr:hypothetical protein [Actinomycetota bacterium]